MTEPAHSYGPTCSFYEDETDQPLAHDADVPLVNAQFFYVSSLPIDDPLSPLPPIQSDKSSQQPPQPFSARDHAALEEAWQGLRAKEDGVRPSSRHKLDKGMVSFPKFREGLRSESPKAPSIERTEAPKSLLRQDSGSVKTRGTLGRHSSDLTRQVISTASNGREEDRTGPNNLEDGASTQASTRTHRTASKTSQQDVMLSQEMETNGRTDPVKAAELGSVRDSASNASKKRQHHSPFRRSTGPKADLSEAKAAETHNQSPVQDDHLSNDISGRPFARAPSARNISAQRFSQFEEESNGERASRSRSLDTRHQPPAPAADHEKVYVPVGVSRLHLVELPDLLMQPIYWSPINDTSKVIRATWFYRDTMLPLPTNLANRLELGYEYIKPFAESYQDELQACIDNGASAEMKVVHKLWDENKKSSRPSTGADKLDDQIPDTPTLPQHDENAAADPSDHNEKRMFETHSVIYIDRKHAQILRPSLLPSVAQKRRPLSSIRKGRQIGVAVVRGFDRKQWMKLHPDPKINATAAQAKVGAYLSQSGDATTRGRRMSCAACDDRYNTPKVSDLVLVIHGIGQKLSERVDSYHFTHAINSLRRDFNVELASEAVKGNLESMSGMMVLPVNWRLTVSFDEGKEQLHSETENFGLKDITPETLPAVRSIISDVMLDIPYYMSHHKEKMTSAVIREANRVYRLWCRNNPGFREIGRVHLIAHSLGSVMAMEILSNQPTKVSTELNFDDTKPSEESFEFNTTNLFCCGSPGGFFLLLNNSRLIPRAGIEKPGMEADSHGPGITSEPQYGCLAVQNIYNVLNKNDPVSYLLNASVDADYAASLQLANIPSASLGLFSRMGSSLRWTTRIVPDPYASNNKTPERPQITQMPSTVELETHNFTREEIAEKRMYLLNENGQIDFFLGSGGGPLEIQYLSMLSAHSSYWISRDFVRFLVVEIGRKQGREETVPVLRAVKKRGWKRGNLDGKTP